MVNENEILFRGNPNITYPKCRSSRGISFKCFKCPSIFERKDSLLNHNLLHGSNKKFKCKTCDYSVSSRELLDKHILKHRDFPGKVNLKSNTSSIRQLQCSECPAIYKNSSDLQLHMLNHGSGKKNQCQFCSFASRRHDHYEKHVLLHNISTDEVYDDDENDQVMEAERKKSSSPKKSLKNQVETKAETVQIENRRCPKCPYKGKSQNQVKLHLKAHGKSIKSRHLCTYCDYSSNQLAQKVNHELLHTNNMKLKVSKMASKISQNYRATSRKKNGISKSLDVKKKEEAIKLVVQNFKTELGTSNAKEQSFVKESNSIKPKIENNNFRFIESVRVRNFMSHKSLDIFPTNIVTFQGNGKSASLCAVLIGLGFDVLDPDYTPSTLCGINLDSSNLITHGSDSCEIELKISLHNSSKLKSKYGSHVSLIRKLERGLPLHLSNFTICSADSEKSYPVQESLMRANEIRKFLKNLNINAPLATVSLVDLHNLQRISHNKGHWYEFYAVIYASRKSEISSKLEIADMKLKRVQGEIQWRKHRLDFLTSQLNNSKDVPILLKKRDQADMKELQDELSNLEELEKNLNPSVSILQNDLNKLSNMLTGRLKFRYQEFLHRQNFVGSILVDERAKTVGIWIGDVNFVDIPPRTVEEANIIWESCSTEFQQLAVISLFFAFIDISYVPIFFIDGFSLRKDEFTLPHSAFPLLFELIQKKCSEGAQFVASVPDNVS